MDRYLAFCEQPLLCQIQPQKVFAAIREGRTSEYKAMQKKHLLFWQNFITLR